MSSLSEETLIVPAELTRRCKGLTLDLGCSVSKCIYRSKEDFDEVANESVTVGRLRLVTFGVNELKQGLEYVRQRAYFVGGSDGNEAPVLNVTGMGCTVFGKLINETLNVRVQNLAEFDCYNKAFHYLANRLSRDQLLHPFLDEATVEPLQGVQCWIAGMQIAKSNQKTQMANAEGVDVAALLQGLTMAVGRPLAAPPGADSDASTTAAVPLAVAEPDIFPCLLTTVGSGVGFFKIEKDGTFKIVDMSNRGGKALFGVGALLTGCKTFEEFIELASKGDPHNVDVYTNEMFDLFTGAGTADSDDIYTKTASAINASPSVVFCFGKAATSNANLDALKPEDKARSWLNYVLLDLVQCAHHVCTINGIKRLVFVGGFFNNQLIRQITTAELARRNLMQMLMAQVEPIRFDFIKATQHLGAIGCLINDFEKFV